MFAATPPLEAKKILLSLWALMEGACLDFIDVPKAYSTEGQGEKYARNCPQKIKKGCMDC